MKRRCALAASTSMFVVCGLACVDLFHGTDYETLCTRAPDDPACGGDSGAAPDVVDSGMVPPRPHPDFCAWSSAEARKQALRACAWLGACEGPLGESAFGPCVARAQLAFDCRATPSLRPRGAVDAFWSCLATVSTCAQVDGCAFPAGVQDCIAVPSGSSTACGTLAGNAATHLKCAGPAGRAVGVEPCVMLGKSCSAETPSVAACTGPLGFTCTKSECSSSKAVDCRTAGARLLDRGVDCAGYGAAQCVVDADGGPTCAGSAGAAACSADKLPSCDGNQVTACIAGKEVRVDCAAVGLPCDVTDPIPPYDLGAGCIDRTTGACTGPDKCIGTTLQSCGRGLRNEVDCASVGLGTCKVDGSGNAACTGF